MKKTIILMLVILMAMSGCGITQINDSIMDNVSTEDKVMQIEDQIDLGAVVEDGKNNKSTVENNSEVGENEADIDPDLKRFDNMNVIIRGVGGSHSGFVKYDEKLYDGTVERKIKGTEGITYTLNSVNIYENLEESGIVLNESILEPNGELNEYKKVLNATGDFIVAEMSATYIALEGGEETVTVHTSRDFLATYFDEKLLEGFEERLIAGDINNPYYNWFEVDEVHKIKSEEWGKGSHDFKISNGETVNFRIGVFAPKELIENENIYLCVNWFPRGFFRDYTHKYFALFPEC